MEHYTALVSSSAHPAPLRPRAPDGHLELLDGGLAALGRHVGHLHHVLHLARTKVENANFVSNF